MLKGKSSLSPQVVHCFAVTVTDGLCPLRRCGLMTFQLLLEETLFLGASSAEIAVYTRLAKALRNAVHPINTSQSIFLVPSFHKT